MKFTEHDRLCIPVPFFHCFGCVLGVMVCVTHGCTMVPVEIFDPLRVLQTIEKEKCTAVHGVAVLGPSSNGNGPERFRDSYSRCGGDQRR